MNLNQSIVESIKSDEIKNIANDYGEILIDLTFEDGILRDIPIIGTIINISKGYLSIQDRIFSKKILTFLAQLKDIPETIRKKALEELDCSKKERVKVGEKILYLVERADDHIKSEYIGKLFAEFIRENITYDEFKRCSDIINKAFLEDLNWFINSDCVKLTMEESTDLINAGLFDMPYALEIENKGDSDIWLGDKYVVKGYDNVCVNPYADVLRKILK